MSDLLIWKNEPKLIFNCYRCGNDTEHELFAEDNYSKNEVSAWSILERIDIKNHKSDNNTRLHFYCKNCLEIVDRVY